MVFFQSSEQKKRHDFIDASIGNYSDILTRASSTSGLIPEHKIRSDRYIINHLTIPNLRHGILQLSKRALHSGDYIPIFPLVYGEPVTIPAASRNSLHPLQREKALQYFNNRGIGLSGYNFDKNSAVDYNDHTTQIEPTTKAYVLTSSKSFIVPNIKSKNKKRIIRTRPHIFIGMNNPEDGKGFLRRNPDTIAHEFTHVAQALEHPVARHDIAGSVEDENLRNELEAYCHQELTLYEMRRQGYSPIEGEPASEWISDTGKPASYIYLINNYRREVNQSRKDKLFPDGKLRKKFLEIGLEIHSTLPENVPRHEALY